MKVGDLVRKSSDTLGKRKGVVLEIGETGNFANVFWSIDYGTFWTLIYHLRKIV